MSGSVEIDVVIAGGVEALASVVQELGLAFREMSRLKTEDGKVHQVQGVIEDGSGAAVGVKVNQKNGQVELVPRDCNGTKGKALAQRVAQRWAHVKVVDELRRKGYRVAREEKQADGTIKVVAERWS